MNAFSTGGRRLWQRTFGSYVYSSPAVWHGRVFFGTYGGSFYGLSAASGSTMWSVADRRAGLRRRRRRRRRRVRRLVLAPHLRRGRAERTGRSPLPARRVRARLGRRRTGCSSTATRGSTPSRSGEAPAADRRRAAGRARPRPRRRLRPLRQAREPRHPRLLDAASSCRPRVPKPRPPKPRHRVADLRPRPGAAARRDRHLARAAVPARLDVPRPEPRRVSARGRVRPALLREQQRRPLRDQREDRQARVEVRLAPLPGRLARGRRARRSTPSSSTGRRATRPAAGSTASSSRSPSGPARCAGARRSRRRSPRR